MRKLILILFLGLSLEAVSQCGGLSAGTNAGNGGSTYTLTGDCIINGDVLITKAKLIIPDGTSLQIIGNLTNSGNGDLDVSGDLDVTGAVSLGGNALFNTDGNVSIGGDFVVTGANADVTVGGGFSVGGTADLGGETLTIQDGAVFQADNVTDAAVVVDNGGTIAAGGLDTITPAPVIDGGNGDTDCSNGCCGDLCDNDGDELSGEGNEVLPVTLYSFNGQRQESQINLKWQTISELNFEKFELSKIEEGNKNLVGIIASSGNSSGDEYTFTDVNPRMGNNIYQIRSVDFDGYTETFSAISVLYQPFGRSFEIYPNPATNGRLKSNVTESFVLTIYSINGKSLFSEKVDGRNLSGLPQLDKGVYIFQMNMNTHLVKQRVIIE